MDDDSIGTGAGLAVAIGGDGTMLRTVDLVAAHGVPVLGINVGQLGYLVEVQPADAQQQMFPNRNTFYTYSGLTAALSAYPGFSNTGSDTVKKQEAAAFLANVSHETGGLVHVVEQNTANYPHYCDTTQPYGCPAGHDKYYGRGPIQLSWNFNYKSAGDALGIDLLNNPDLVQTDSSVAWKTGLWYWNTQNGPGSMTPHNAIVNGAGFGETIRCHQRQLECNGGNPHRCRAASTTTSASSKSSASNRAATSAAEARRAYCLRQSWPDGGHQVERDQVAQSAEFRGWRYQGIDDGQDHGSGFDGGSTHGPRRRRPSIGRHRERRRGVRPGGVPFRLARPVPRLT